MSEAYERWQRADSRLSNARGRVYGLHSAIGPVALALDAWDKPGSYDIEVTIPALPTWPGAQHVIGAAEELRDALLEERAAFEALTPEEKARAPRGW
jgi:hypothetical protein